MFCAREKKRISNLLFDAEIGVQTINRAATTPNTVCAAEIAMNKSRLPMDWWAVGPWIEYLSNQ
jgi:hypothetical protein